MTVSTEIKLPKLLKVNSGYVSLETIDPWDVDNLGQFQKYVEVTHHLLALLPDEDKANADHEDKRFILNTDCLAALKYAFNECMLDEFLTFHNAALEHFIEDIHLDATSYDLPASQEELGDAIEQIVDTKIDRGLFEVVLLEDGNLYVRIDE